MSRTARATGLAVFLAAVLAGGVLTPAAAETGNSFAGGHGNLISGGELRTFSFAAMTQADGTTSGIVEVKNRFLDIRILMAVDCLIFEGANRAIVSGTIMQSSNPALIAEGRVGVFGVEDNGEGANSAEDRITTIPDYPAPKSCTEFRFVGNTLQEVANPSTPVRVLTPILGGNIQVLP